MSQKEKWPNKGSSPVPFLVSPLQTMVNQMCQNLPCCSTAVNCLISAQHLLQTRPGPGRPPAGRHWRNQRHVVGGPVLCSTPKMMSVTPPVSTPCLSVDLVTSRKSENEKRIFVCQMSGTCLSNALCCLSDALWCLSDALAAALPAVGNCMTRSTKHLASTWRKRWCRSQVKLLWGPPVECFLTS